MILARIKAGLKKRKVKVFLIFLFFSFLAWFVNNLAKSFVSTTNFDLGYINVPKDFLLAATPKSQVQVRLRAVGYQFIGFGINKNKVRINLAEVRQKDTQYYIPPEIYRKQIQRQLSNGMELLDIDSDTIFLHFTSLVSKEVPVIPRLNLSFAQNHALIDSISITPPTVSLKGPKTQIDSISSVQTALLELPDLDADFTEKVNLAIHKTLDKTSFEPSSVIVSGQVYRFSEQVFKVPVIMENLPQGLQVRMFPDEVAVVCQAPLETLKKIKAADFRVIADYTLISGDDLNVLPLQLAETPMGINNAVLRTKEVEFIFKKE